MKIRVTGRFYLVLAFVVLLVVFLLRDVLFASSEITAVYAGSASDTRKVQCVVVRDEVGVTRDPSNFDLIKYTARERSQVNVGDPVAEVYMKGNAQKTINDLNATRVEIQKYHKILLGNELDSTLNELNLTVQQRALELKALISGDVRGNLLQAVDNLTAAMEARRTHLRSNQMFDPKLVKYYGQEDQNERAIETKIKYAPISGIVSFYTDGYEQTLNADTVLDLSISDIEAVLRGELLGEAPKNKKDECIFRVLNQNHWYIVLLSNDKDWSPTLDTRYTFVVDGYEDLVYEGTVILVPQTGTTVMAVLEVNQPIDSLMYFRKGNASIGADMTGMIVSKEAITTQSGKKGVLKYDVPGGTFVEVEVLADRGDGTVLILPLSEGSLTIGDQVLIK